MVDIENGTRRPPDAVTSQTPRYVSARVKRGFVPVEATRNPVRSPEGRRALEERRARLQPTELRTFYQAGGVQVTDRWVTSSGRRYPVAALANLRTVREPAGPVSVVSKTMACVFVAAVTAFAAMTGEPLLIVGGPLLAAVPAGFALVVMRLRGRPLALYAEYGDQTVQVFGAADARRYHQICRALIRAREFDRERRDR
jgi:hypothetical protein